jgi:uncharacterized membrane protein (DUF485 family)
MSAQTAHGPAIDWVAVERSPEFRELSSSRRRFAAAGAVLGVGAGAAYVVLANLARDLMGTQVLGKMSLGFLGGVALILLTWAITWAYVRRSKRVWAPLEERIRERALAAVAPEAVVTARSAPTTPEQEVGR